MTVSTPHRPRHARPVSPWQGIARQAAHEWFRDNGGAPWVEFDAWVTDVWEPREFLAAGYGWRPGRPVHLEAFAGARLGLREALGDEQRRRAGREVPLAGHRGVVERPAGPGAGVGATNGWWDRLGGAA